MTTLRAPPAAIKVRDRLYRDDELGAGVGQFDAQLTAAIKKLSRKRPAYEPVNPGDPTPEWMAKARAVHGVGTKTVGAGEIAPIKQHKVKTPIEHYGPHFSVSEISALEQFIEDAEKATRVNVTSSYEGMTTKGTGKPRHGGVPDALREAHVRDDHTRKMLHPRLLEIAEWLLIEVRREAWGRAKSMEEIGGAVFPGIKDKATRKGVSLGLLKGLAWRLDQIYARDRAMTGRPARDTRFVRGTAVRVPNQELLSHGD